MNYKLSHYTVSTQVSEDKYVIFSTRSCKVLLLQKENYQSLINGHFDTITAEIKNQLITALILVPSFENELMEIVEENKMMIDTNNVLYQVIQPSSNCQLGCDYCGQEHTKNDLQAKDYEKLIERIRHKLSLKDYRALLIGWFGGEPLMSLQTLRKVTGKLKEITSELGIDYSAKMTTNGLALKKNIFLELVNQHDVKTIEVTLDGTAEFHDKRRFVKSGENSFHLIFKNLVDIFSIENYKELGARISIRCNVDRTNYQSVVPLLQLMHEHGFHEKISHFYVAPIHSWGNEAHLVSLEKETFAEKEIEWILEQYKYGFSPSVLPVRNHELCMITNPDAELIDAFGNIYNCTEVPYVPAYESTEHKLGNIKDIKIDQKFGSLHLQNWNDVVLTDQKGYPCHTCKMFPVCGGGCPKSWEEGIIACPSNKFNIQDKLAINYITQEKGTEYLMS
ncbi:radical SAM/SPASM domain-containing protein [Chryseobacterium indologenes]|uniref:radical SAM/SPASM domain-containing protein n=1 Tax=Chryseobacterium indologenes TaxID=253 RepID=UPI0010244E40|nr:radical SAM protein [Chryseobacterium indologenes]MBF6643410.1 SPASM domain-containing protein [Chryseobacterium indologenes]MBU3049973.1 SPASM domain-containing protein [Chryseobacterium indologenes]MEB4762531.1 radical SAM protein [Chryseobacterium indologenes]QIX82035.1 SPASM domain-containing protein [Chryseobacterium indologenes]QQQ72707.1 SPASM domain-containing protein [Chryseobacterium indologenes]